MSKESDFVLKRIIETKGQISETTKIRLLVFYREKTFIDCEACSFYHNGKCEDQGGYKVPEALVPFGCGKGELDIPF